MLLSNYAHVLLGKDLHFIHEIVHRMGCIFQDKLGSLNLQRSKEVYAQKQLSRESNFCADLLELDPILPIQSWLIFHRMKPNYRKSEDSDQ